MSRISPIPDEARCYAPLTTGGERCPNHVSSHSSWWCDKHINWCQSKYLKYKYICDSVPIEKIDINYNINSVEEIKSLIKRYTRKYTNLKLCIGARKRQQELCYYREDENHKQHVVNLHIYKQKLTEALNKLYDKLRALMASTTRTTRSTTIDDIEEEIRNIQLSNETTTSTEEKTLDQDLDTIIKEFNLQSKEMDAKYLEKINKYDSKYYTFLKSAHNSYLRYEAELKFIMPTKSDGPEIKNIIKSCGLTRSQTMKIDEIIDKFGLVNKKPDIARMYFIIFMLRTALCDINGIYTSDKFNKLIDKIVKTKRIEYCKKTEDYIHSIHHLIYSTDIFRLIYIIKEKAFTEYVIAFIDGYRSYKNEDIGTTLNNYSVFAKSITDGDVRHEIFKGTVDDMDNIEGIFRNIMEYVSMGYLIEATVSDVDNQKRSMIKQRITIQESKEYIETLNNIQSAVELAIKDYFYYHDEFNKDFKIESKLKTDAMTPLFYLFIIKYVESILQIKFNYTRMPITKYSLAILIMNSRVTIIQLKKVLPLIEAESKIIKYFRIFIEGIKAN